MERGQYRRSRHLPLNKTRNIQRRPLKTPKRAAFQNGPVLPNASGRAPGGTLLLRVQGRPLARDVLGVPDPLRDAEDLGSGWSRTSGVSDYVHLYQCSS